MNICLFILIFFEFCFISAIFHMHKSSNGLTKKFKAEKGVLFAEFLFETQSKCLICQCTHIEGLPLPNI